MDIWQWICGEITAEVSSADIRGFLAAAQQAQIELRSLEITGPFSIRFQIQRRAWSQLSGVVQRRGDKLERKAQSGLYRWLYQVRKRPVLSIGILVLLIFSLFAPSRVFFVRVEGNLTVPTRKIVEAAAECGISFGASRRQVRSEKIKNALLDAMPELSWAGVNTYGCSAVICVRERNDSQNPAIPQTVSSIVACRDGVITQMTVLRGNKLCSVGQAVREGQVLISGYTDCGLTIQATNAKGEVYAHTGRELSVICPTISDIRVSAAAVEKKFSLIIGNKRINFSNSSGISGAGCAKIYEENYIVLPGGFRLPLAICVETWTMYETQTADTEILREKLSEFSEHYLLQQMCAGNILLASEQFTHGDGIMQLSGSYSCIEMIGITRLEENILDYVEND